MATEYPEYYLYEEIPVVFIEPAEGGLDCLALSKATGAFERDMRFVHKIRFGTTAEIWELDRTEFIQHVEKYRGEHLRGDGPAFALYETIKALEANAQSQRKPLSDAEAALVRTLRFESHELFEKSLREKNLTGTPATPGSF
ncbi:hypothetical protein [Actinomadura algeriensis]|uniref:CarD-like/TRCF RNAP-interacting domain-containing protein n=1 Tax=Actinomadura algeriensis TaxID=1679523 RepID=A0ABR9JS30_9ACTN|nr:hypothetical protein [Actinomadura algeriensis]MBE1533362.1 hypothetical protein [Actinomadura algeriensis]